MPPSQRKPDVTVPRAELPPVVESTSLRGRRFLTAENDGTTEPRYVDLEEVDDPKVTAAELRHEAAELLALAEALEAREETQADRVYRALIRAAREQGDMAGVDLRALAHRLTVEGISTTVVPNP